LWPEPGAAAAAPPPPFRRVAVIGLGLIGGSIALAVKQRWPSVHLTGVDRPRVVEAATRLQVADVATDRLEALVDVDLVILAAPVKQNLSLLTQIADHVRSSVVVTDTGSTKREIVAAAAAFQDRFTFVGGHPLGGAAFGGLDHARADLFRHRSWLLTPGPGTPDRAVEHLTQFAEALGSHPAVMPPDEHDRLLAFLSHLPQITASALMAIVGQASGRSGLALAGRGLIDTTRLASSPADIWRDIAATNADQIGPALDALIALLQQLRSDLSEGRRLGEVFDEAAAWRDRLVSGTTI
jgi:prephenate dehydrogenase